MKRFHQFILGTLGTLAISATAIADEVVHV